MIPGSRSHARRERRLLAAHRTVERRVRKRVLAFRRWVGWQGRSLAQAAAYLDLKPATLGAWERAWRADRLRQEELGRPRHRLSYEVRTLLVSLFTAAGPHLSLDTLRALFPYESPAALDEWRRYLQARGLREGRLNLLTLNWTRAGAVWALDFFYAPRPIDGVFKYVLVVRDLASHCILLALPTPDRGAAMVANALRFLLAAYGRPLVLKTDNEFDAEEVRQVLEEAGVFQLLSPPRFPRYNGSIEAGIGSLKTRVFYEAARYGRPAQWTCDDVEAGRLQANELARPRGYPGPTPDELWARRQSLTEEERAAFKAAVQKRQAESRRKLGFPTTAEPGWPVAAKLDRPVAAESGRPVAAELDRPVAAELDRPVAAESGRPVAAKLDRQPAAKLGRPVATKSGWPAATELCRQEQNTVSRLALALALVDRGYLWVRRKRITPPIRLRFS